MGSIIFCKREAKKAAIKEMLATTKEERNACKKERLHYETLAQRIKGLIWH